MKFARIGRSTLAISIALLTAAASQAEARDVAPSVSYAVTIPQPHTHVFVVEMKVAGLAGETLDVSMPVWTPGSYLVREYERHVIRFAATDESGHEMSWHKLDKNTWRIATAGSPGAVIEYEVYAREPGIRWSFVYEGGGHILGPSLFMHVVGATDEPTSATFALPQDWRVDGGIAPTGQNPFVISASSYHDLIDTPMLIGQFEDIEFEVEGIPHVIAILGPNNADLEELARDFAKIVEVCAEMFGGLPYERYAFVFTTLTGGGGIEHANGTTIGLGGLDFQSDRGRRAVLGVTAHEFFHAWNVKRIQPPAFRPYDYEEENYTDALWFYEGFTSYYGDRILYRAGLIDSYDDPANLVARYRSTQGHYNQSAADASFNAWIHLYRSDESTENYRTDYYFKGRVIGNLLEIELANRTGGAKGVDDVLRLMWQRTRDENAAFDSEAIRDVCEEVAGSSFQDFFYKYVYGTDEIPFEEFFELAGFRLVIDEDATRQRNSTGFLGVATQDLNGRLRIMTVVSGSPAWRDGLNYGDDILAIDGTAITGYESFVEVLRQHAPGDTIHVRVSRFGQEKTIAVTLGVRDTPVYRVVEIEYPSDEQLAVRKRWRE
jgi:predicted metalloprotease with PDZ domain